MASYVNHLWGKITSFSSRILCLSFTSNMLAGRRLALATGLALATRATMATSLHTYSGKTIAGGSLSMEALAGKPVIMLNVASR